MQNHQRFHNATITILVSYTFLPSHKKSKLYKPHHYHQYYIKNLKPNQNFTNHSKQPTDCYCFIIPFSATTSPYNPITTNMSLPSSTPCYHHLIKDYHTIKHHFTNTPPPINTTIVTHFHHQSTSHVQQASEIVVTQGNVCQ